LTYETLSEHLPKPNSRNKEATGHFIKGDVIDVALYVKHENQKNPIVLLSADPKIPGGKDHESLYGEETDVWRRTTIRENIDVELRQKYYTEAADKFEYDIPQNGVIYAPNVTVFRESQKKGYSLKEPEQLSFALISPLIKISPKEEQNRPELNAAELDLYKKKIASVFLAGIANGHDSVVLTAFGCGYANNRPSQVAEVMFQVVRQFRFSFTSIVFAILDNKQSQKKNPTGNVQPFEVAYKTMAKQSQKPNVQN